MRRNDAVLAPAPPSLVAVPRPQLADEVDGALRPSIIITILVIATAIIVSATIFLLLRFISVHCHRRRRRSSVSDSFPRQQPPVFSEDAADPDLINASSSSSIIESLPVFTFGSVTSAKSGGDCAVCLSKFEAEDRLRLLPACCHAFHADCIDAWIASSHTCPLCRSSILFSESDAITKILSATPPPDHSATESFRVEIGSVSRRRLPSEAGSEGGNHGRSYSIGSSFDYILDDSASEVAVASTRSCRRPPDLGDKSGRTVDEPSLAAEVANGGERLRTSWLKEYVDRMGGWTPTFSLSSSLRSSGRFFLGSSRRSTDASRALEADLEASPLGDEISEMFRWLSSGV